MPEVSREYRIKFEKVPPGELAVPDSEKLGMRSKLGGEPTWCQSPEVPDCPACKKQMSFIAQIDSMEHDADYNPHAIGCLSNQQHYMFGDVGMIFVFMCFNCNETKSVVQCG